MITEYVDSLLWQRHVTLTASFRGEEGGRTVPIVAVVVAVVRTS